MCSRYDTFTIRNAKTKLSHVNHNATMLHIVFDKQLPGKRKIGIGVGVEQTPMQVFEGRPDGTLMYRKD